MNTTNASSIQIFTSNEVGVNCISSLVVAEMFDIRHDNLCRTIIALAEDDGGLLNFEESSYQNEQNKTQPMWLMTELGFYALMISLSLKTEEHKTLRKRILAKFAAFQQNLIKRNLKLEKAHETRNEGKGKYGYILVDEGGKFLKKYKVLKEDHDEKELLAGKIQHIRDVIYGLETRIAALDLELEELENL